MKKLRSLIALLTAALLLFGAALAADEPYEMVVTIGTQMREEAEAKTFSFYPIGEDITLGIWVPLNSGAAKYIDNYAQNEAFQRAMEVTGVNLEFTHPPIGQEKENFNLMIASMDLPDIVYTASYYKGGVEMGVNDGFFVELTDLIAEYSPSYNMLLENVDKFWQEATGADGRVYAYYLYKEAASYMEGDHTRLQARTDWMQEAGMDLLVTYDDCAKFFQWILDNKEGVVPYGLNYDGIDSRMMYGFGLNAGYFLNDEGKVTHYYSEPALKDYLATMHDWYEKGYISPDFTSGGASKAFYAGEMAAFCGSTATSYLTGLRLGFDVDPQPYTLREPGQKIFSTYTLYPVNSTSTPTQISASSEHIKEAMEFLDYGFTLDGCYNYGYGPKDVAWTMGENGKPAYTDHILNNPDFAAIEDVNYVIRYHTGMAIWRPLDQEALPYLYADPACQEQRLRFMDDPDVDFYGHTVPTLALTEEASAERAEIMTNCDTYAKEMILKFIVGAEPLDNFDTYLATLQSMNFERVIELTQEAYDVYQAKTR